MVLDVCINTIVRNGEDVIEFCLSPVLPYVKRAIVTVDSRSNDRTREILANMQCKYHNLEVRGFEIRNAPRKHVIADLKDMRNSQLDGVKEKWIWIIDSDEYYPEAAIKGIELSEEFDVYMPGCWSVWDGKMAQDYSSKWRIPRIFKNNGRVWNGKFGRESLLKITDKTKVLKVRYIHFTHLKADRWRDEVRMRRKNNYRRLVPMPLDIVSEVEKFYELQKMQNM